MTLFDLLTKKELSNLPIVSAVSRGQLEYFNKEEYLQELLRHVSLLKKCNIQKGDQVILMAETSFRWHCLDMAIMLLGGIVIPLFPNLSEADFETVTNSLGPKLIIGDDFKYKKLAPLLSLDDLGKYDFSYQELLKESSHLDIDFYNLTKELNPDDDCCYLATSGTTGSPKLAPFTHLQIHTLLKSIELKMKGKLTKGSRSHTTLPLSHVLGRCDSLLHLVLPVVTQFGNGLDRLEEELPITKPNHLITIPQVISHIRATFEKSLEDKSFIEKTLFTYSLNLADQFHIKAEKNKRLPRLQLEMFHLTQNLLKKGLKGSGLENLRFFVVGGSAVQEGDFNFFRNLGFPILKGYGLTETLGPLTISDFSDPRADSTGSPFHNVEIKVASDGEILVKSPFMARGYLNEESSPINEDGFFQTGDIGEFSADHHLILTDRKKHIITTSKGRNISPQRIEAQLKNCDRVENAMVCLNKKHQIIALISTHKSRFQELIRDGLITSDLRPEEYPREAALIQAILEDIQHVNSKLASDEKIQGFSILPIRLSRESAFLTPSLKLKRELLYNKFKKEINAPHTSL